MRTESKTRVILDTNIIVSGILFKGQTIRELLLIALNDCEVVFSQATWDELAVVLQRNDFEKQMPLGARLRVLAELASKTIVVESTSVVSDCRDPKDNKFLSLALDAGVSCIVTGDADLRVLHPYQNIAIYSPAEFLQAHA